MTYPARNSSAHAIETASDRILDERNRGQRAIVLLTPAGHLYRGAADSIEDGVGLRESITPARR